jgi:UDP-N-acetyl-D-mannosaminuronic acid transferase (WecB/TagA/CpsF family)
LAQIIDRPHRLVARLRIISMNMLSGSVSGRWGKAFGLPFPVFGWSDSFSMLETVADIRVGCRTVSFLSLRQLLRSLVDRDYRDAMARRLLLPDSRWVAAAVGLVSPGRPVDAFDAARFVPSLLTFMEASRRVTLTGADEARLQAASRHLMAHSPWHQVTTVLLSEPVCGRRPIAADELLEAAAPDVVIADARHWQEEILVERYLSFRHDGLALLAGRFFDAAAARSDAPSTAAQVTLTNYSPNKFNLS